MSHVFQISDEQYAKLTDLAAQRGQTPEALFQAWMNEVTHNVEDETLNDPLLQIAGIFAIGDPDLGNKHDEYLAETYRDDHANN